MRRQLGNEEEPEHARTDRVGAVSSKLAIAGDALLLPDLIQNIGDRPIAEVRQLLITPKVHELLGLFVGFEMRKLWGIKPQAVVQVMHFFSELQTLPANPDVQSLRQVFQWYDDGFLGGVNYEDDPVGAWRLCVPPPPLLLLPLYIVGRCLFCFVP